MPLVGAGLIGQQSEGGFNVSSRISFSQVYKGCIMVNGIENLAGVYLM